MRWMMLAGAAALMLAGCGGTNAVSANSAESTEITATGNLVGAPEATPEPDPEPTATPSPDVEPADAGEPVENDGSASLPDNSVAE